jgi:hypothetical protein
MRRRSGWSLFGSGERAGAHEPPHGELGQPDSEGPSHFPTLCEQWLAMCRILGLADLKAAHAGERAALRLTR